MNDLSNLEARISKFEAEARQASAELAAKPANPPEPAAHSELTAAAIKTAAETAGAHDPAMISALVPAGEKLSPAEAVAVLKATKPFLFKPPSAREMSPEEYQAAKRQLLRNSERARVGLPPRK
ncbi:hypothetical protein [Acidocella facilis]|uniref:hypothetical protein n=1 Tax=Acidocella facilis TaxID=525 RepID=UPI001F304202|nr:hypothetical protein [Acidocella facilis]